MTRRFFIGFDFSIVKPACCVIKEERGKLSYSFHYFPKNQPAKDVEVYKNLDVNIINRNVDSVELDYDTTVMAQIVIAKELARIIRTEVFDPILVSEGTMDYTEVYVATEGLSFASNGKSILDLATYKAIFLSEVAEVVEVTNIRTFPPISIKKFAGCKTAVQMRDKDVMLRLLLAREDVENISKFTKDLKSKSPTLMKKTRFAAGVDDLIDAFWCAELLRDTMNCTQSK